MKKMILMVIAVLAIATNAQAQAWDMGELRLFKKDIKSFSEMVELQYASSMKGPVKIAFGICIKEKRMSLSMAMADEWIKMRKLGNPQSSSGFSYGIAYSIVLTCLEESYNFKSANPNPNK